MTRQYTEIEQQIVNEIKSSKKGFLEQINADEEIKNIILHKKVECMNSSFAIGHLFLKKMKSQAEAGVKLGIPYYDIVSLTSGFDIGDSVKIVMDTYGITEEDIDKVISEEFTKHEKYVDSLIAIFNKYEYKEITKEDLLLDKKTFGLRDKYYEYYQSIEDFQKLMSQLIYDLLIASDDEYSLNYYPSYAEKESLMWTLLRKFVGMSFSEIEELSEGRIDKFQLATLECPYETEYDVKFTDRALYFNILKSKFPHYLKTFKLMEYHESKKKAMFVNVPIFKEDKERLVNATERMYCEDVLLDGVEMYLVRISFIKQ